jgi:hypothetical protein
MKKPYEREDLNRFIETLIMAKCFELPSKRAVNLNVKILLDIAKDVLEADASLITTRFSKSDTITVRSCSDCDKEKDIGDYQYRDPDMKIRRHKICLVCRLKREANPSSL